MNYIHFKALQEFTDQRSKIIQEVCRMTRQEIGETISEAFLLNGTNCDEVFKKQLNNTLSKSFLQNLKCGSPNAKFVSRIDDEESGYLDTILGQSDSPLDFMIAVENLVQMSGQTVSLDSKAFANDLHVTQRHARRIQTKQSLINSFQIDLFESLVGT